MSALPSPVPFIVRHEDETHVPQSFILSDEGRVALLRGEARKANAAFIVRACNSHAALVETLELGLRDSLNLCASLRHSGDVALAEVAARMAERARAALALAKGGQQ